MPRTITIDIPDDLVPQLDRVLKRWSYRNTDEATLLHVLRHGLEMMDMAGGPTGADAPTGDLDDDLPI
jgi:hypothetical protein